jgi:beta-glucanase (GH16 family)
MTNYFSTDHFLQPATGTVLLYEDFSNSQYHYDWERPDWDTWGKMLFKDSQVSLINNILILTTDTNTVVGELPRISGEITSTKFFNRVYGYYECCMKTCGEWDAFWLFISPNQSDTVYRYEIDGMEFNCNTDNTFSSTIWNYGKHNNDPQNPVMITSTTHNFKKTLTANYHVYGIDWQVDHVSIYLDEILLWTWTGKIPNTPMYIVVNNQYAGGEIPASNYTKFIRVQDHK